MLLGRVLGHDVAGKGGGRGQSPPPPTLSRPRRPEEEDEEVQFNLSLRHSSHRHGSLQLEEEDDYGAGQKQGGTGVELGLVGGSHVGGGWASTGRSRGCRGGGAGQQQQEGGGGELDPDLSLHHQPHQLSTLTPTAETSSLNSQPINSSESSQTKGCKVILNMTTRA